jgi:hypothetical protein
MAYMVFYLQSAMNSWGTPSEKRRMREEIHPTEELR